VPIRVDRSTGSDRFTLVHFNMLLGEAIVVRRVA
jgi:hypothetical protein